MQLLQRSETARVAGGDCEGVVIEAPAFDPATDPFYNTLVDMINKAAEERQIQEILEQARGIMSLQHMLIILDHLAANGTANGYVTEYGDYVATDAETFAHNVDGLIAAVEATGEAVGDGGGEYGGEYGGGYGDGGGFGGGEGGGVGAMGGEGGC